VPWEEVGPQAHTACVWTKMHLRVVSLLCVGLGCLIQQFLVNPALLLRPPLPVCLSVVVSSWP
jgi:hypothetical protein